MARKILNIRLFDGEDGKRWNKSVMDKQLEVLCVSQFTLSAVLKGNKPDFHEAMGPDTSEEAYHIFNRENLFPIVCAGLQYSVYGAELAITAANCLYTITEDNAPIIKICEDPDVIQLLNSLVSLNSDSSDLVLLKTLATGILVNVRCGSGRCEGGSVIPHY